ncbi:MAG: chromosome segregation protein SMC [Bifidobacteriaceae bacterium]|nr:chromosome segregation protein SMC [Bifidobacteriaceae bacterium]
MYLKTLTLRGFKSFASATRLNFEPGITCVVGPNGAGKSNVVDALAWVMGEQGAKSLRGGKMEDVIFAGTRTRPPLGRAEVRLTIDNSDGALPIDYTEVTISRILFHGGGSEYAINGTPCRLLDIQELLSDSGLGHEMHVIVGQGHLDDVLTAGPLERRGFIEEAAGVLKHRKRKERALRKLDSAQASLTRLEDLTAEIRRQLGPLAKQADVARRAHSIQVTVRDAQARLLADDAAQVQATMAAEAADETALNEQREALRSALAESRAALASAEAAAALVVPVLSRTAETHFRASALHERVRGTRKVAAERARLLGQGEFHLPSAGVGGAGTADGLEALIVSLRAEHQAVDERLDQADAVRLAADSAARQADQAFRAEESRYTAALRAAADRREALATLAGQVATARSRLEGRTTQIAHLTEQLRAAESARLEAQEEFTDLEQRIAGVEDGEAALDASHQRATEELDRARLDYGELLEEQASGRAAVAAATAARDTLELAMSARDGSAALAGRGTTLGPLAELWRVEPGFERAVGAALGPAAAALAVPGLGQAVDALRLARDQDLGQAALAIAGLAEVGAGPETDTDSGVLPGQSAGQAAELVVGRWAAGLVCPAEGLDQMASASAAALIGNLLAMTVVTDNLAEAQAVVAADPSLRAVTRDGDLLSASFATGGSDAGQSLIELTSAKTEAENTIAKGTAAIEELAFRLKAADDRVAQASEGVAQTMEALSQSDAKHAAVADRLGHLAATVGAQREAGGKARQRLDQAEAALAEDQAALVALVTELEAARGQAAPDEPEGSARSDTNAGSDSPSRPDAPAGPDQTERDRLWAAVQAARQSANEATLEVRTLAGHLDALTTRIAATERAAATERRAEQHAQELAARRAAQADIARSVEQACDDLEVLVARTASAARDERDQAEADRAEAEAEAARLRGQIDQCRSDLTELTSEVHREELARAAGRAKLDALAAKAFDQLGLTMDSLISEYGPDQAVPDVANPEAEPRPYVRQEQDKRLHRAQRELATLGKVNPLALEEYAALEERHKFLMNGLDDVKRSRADLLDVIRQIDSRVEQIFADAFRDTAEAFEHVFGRLFPGGEGHLIATEPGDWLATGVDIEARPAGKAVKRLSLLSGGERSLVAVAFTLAIFLARPSPFYVMDEVEAALDETNLGRLLELIAELRSGSQVLMVTHQKRSMEIADALYGVTMRDDGVSTVISQRLGPR